MRSFGFALFYFGGINTSIYKQMYLSLFNSITEALEENDIERIKQILVAAQIKTEEMCIESSED